MARAGGGKVQKRLYYKIGEACKILDIQPYVLRYWETEFPALSPGKSRSGQRVYGEKELALIRRIKVLLYEEGYTIAGAKKKLEAELATDGGVEGEAAADDAGGEAATAAEASDQGAEAPDRARLEGLRSGLAEALEETQALLALLD
jgi:DNA-binding transcriptional MerR regulator